MEYHYHSHSNHLVYSNSSNNSNSHGVNTNMNVSGDGGGARGGLTENQMMFYYNKGMNGSFIDEISLNDLEIESHIHNAYHQQTSRSQTPSPSLENIHYHSVSGANTGFVPHSSVYTSIPTGTGTNYQTPIKHHSYIQQGTPPPPPQLQSKSPSPNTSNKSKSSKSMPIFANQVQHSPSSSLILPSQTQAVTLRKRIRKAPSFSGYSNQLFNLLDFSFIMVYLNCIEPSGVLALELPSHNIQKINNERFELFDNLIYLDLNNNFVQFNQLSLIPNLNELYLSNNSISNLEFVKGFKNLKKLDLSNNSIDSNHFKHLMSITSLVNLNLSHNNIKTLPEDLSCFSSLESLVLEHNTLDIKNTMENLSTLPSLRLLNLNDNQWDRILPINGCFKSLFELSLCNNFISNLLSIGNLYHTSYPLLTRVLLWGNMLKSNVVNFQVSKTIQLIIKPPPTSPIASGKIETPSTYPPKTRKKPTKSPSLSQVVSTPYHSYKLNASEPIFYQHQYYHQSESPSLIEQKLSYATSKSQSSSSLHNTTTGTPYKPPPKSSPKSITKVIPFPSSSSSSVQHINRIQNQTPPTSEEYFNYPASFSSD